LEVHERIALIIEYDGTRYHGSQSQVNANTIQGELENALQKLTGETIRIACASRTDAGVHSKGQVVSFMTASSFSEATWLKALNFYLPFDIAVRSAYKVKEEFNVRRDALNRQYKYYIFNRFSRSPIMQRFAFWIPRPLDIVAMNSTSQVLIGEHDFAPFTSATVKKTTRTVHKAEFYRKGDLLIFDIIANSFLLHQVRNTVGGLIKVGLGKILPSHFQELARSKQYGVIGPAAPAYGLCLINIDYADFPPRSAEVIE
jgi:tRNA pseudouridine38-40 synthase